MLRPSTPLKSGEQASFNLLLDEDDGTQRQSTTCQFFLLCFLNRNLLIVVYDRRPYGVFYANIILFIASFCCLLISTSLYLEPHSDKSLLHRKTFYCP